MELLVVVEEATMLEFAFTELVELLETSVLLAEAKLETDDFWELAATDDNETELFFVVALAFDITDDELFADVELKTPLETAVDRLLATTEFATAIEDFFVATADTAVEDFLAENDFDLPTVFSALEEEFSAVASETCIDTSSRLFSSWQFDSPVFIMLDFLSSAENSSPDTFFIRLLTVSCIRFDVQFASVLLAVKALL